MFNSVGANVEGLVNLPIECVQNVFNKIHRV